MRVGRAGKFVKSIRGQLAEHIAVNVHGGDRRVAVLGEARLVKARKRKYPAARGSLL